MKRLILFLSIIIFLVGCGTNEVILSLPTSTTTPIIPTATATVIPEPIVKFLSPNFLGYSTDDRVNLGVGIYALSKDILFLLGGVGDSGSSQQSTLLRSKDGGKHWLEAMNPQKGSSVVDFQMLDTGEGWALVMWVIEGPGTPILFHTIDYGESWTQISEIPKPAWFATPANMVFFDELHGQLVMSVVGGLNDRLAFMSTVDGGLTWEETGSYSPQFEGRMKSSAILSLYNENIKDFSHSTSLDYSSKWKVEDIGENITIYRQLHENYSWSDWEIVNNLPKHFEYTDNQIIVP